LVFRRLAPGECWYPKWESKLEAQILRYHVEQQEGAAQMDAILRPSRFDAYLPFIHDGAGEFPSHTARRPADPQD